MIVIDLRLIKFTQSQVRAVKESGKINNQLKSSVAQKVKGIINLAFCYAHTSCVSLSLRDLRYEKIGIFFGKYCDWSFRMKRKDRK